MKTASAILALLVTAASCAPDGGSGESALTWTFGLGDLSTEVAYFNSSGFGTVSVIDNPNVPDVAITVIYCGVKYIEVNPAIMGLQPAELQYFYLAHEFGHHYRGDAGKSTCATGDEEYLADAYGIRVCYANQGLDFAHVVIDEMARYGSGGDATHPPGVERAAFMATTLDDLLRSPDLIPTPPGFTRLLPSVGFAILSDITGDGSYCYVDGFYVGTAPPCGYGCVPLAEGDHFLQFYDALNGSLIQGVAVRIARGMSTYAPQVLPP